jgi:hypothetical protein
VKIPFKCGSIQFWQRFQYFCQLTINALESGRRYIALARLGQDQHNVNMHEYNA